jgi:uncharacterized protein
MEKLNPISKNSRIHVVDVLRGFALLGVLIANIPFDHEINMGQEINDPLNWLYDLFINRKFITLFSILFGFGFYIQMKRTQEKGGNFATYFVIRMGILFLIGTIHCFFLWNGDILMSYALGGVLLLFIKNWSTKKLVTLAIILSVVMTGILFIGNNALGWQNHSYDFILILQHPIVNTYTEYLKINFQTAQWTNFISDMPVTLTFTVGNMIIGFILGKVNFFVRPKKLQKLTNRLLLIGFFPGLVCSYLFHLVNTGALDLSIELIWLPFLVIAGMIHQTLAYIALFVKLWDKVIFRKIVGFFKYVGRTALSNYIAQSIFYLLVIFHAVNQNGLYGKLTRGETYILALIFFMFQSLLSFFWLKKHTQGPIEQYWKKMAYNHLVKTS